MYQNYFSSTFQNNNKIFCFNVLFYSTFIFFLYNQKLMY